MMTLFLGQISDSIRAFHKIIKTSNYDYHSKNRAFRIYDNCEKVTPIDYLNAWDESFSHLPSSKPSSFIYRRHAISFIAAEIVYQLCQPYVIYNSGLYRNQIINEHFSDLFQLVKSRLKPINVNKYRSSLLTEMNYDCESSNEICTYDTIYETILGTSNSSKNKESILLIFGGKSKMSVIQLVLIVNLNFILNPHGDRKLLYKIAEYINRIESNTESYGEPDRESNKKQYKESYSEQDRELNKLDNKLTLLSLKYENINLLANEIKNNTDIAETGISNLMNNFYNYIYSLSYKLKSLFRAARSSKYINIQSQIIAELTEMSICNKYDRLLAMYLDRNKPPKRALRKFTCYKKMCNELSV